jgi:hypothetical protein
MRVADVPKFEKKNDITVNVFGYEKQEIYPIHLTKERGFRHVNLLVITSGEKTHYCWIKNLNLVQSLNVRISLPLHEEEVWIQCTAVVPRYGLFLLRGENQ